MSLFTWLRNFFGQSQSDVANQVIQLAQRARPVIQEIELVKANYKQAETLIDKNAIVLDYAKAKDAYSISIANQLIYCPAAALWTELAVIGLKAIYPAATGYYLRCAITLAYAYFATQQQKQEQNQEAKSEVAK